MNNVEKGSYGATGAARTQMMIMQLGHEESTQQRVSHFDHGLYDLNAVLSQLNHGFNEMDKVDRGLSQ